MKFTKSMFIPFAFAVIPFYSNQAVAADTTPPSVPSSLKIVAKTDTSVSISWSASTDNVGVKNYRIYRNGNSITSVNGTVNNDSPLRASTTYTYSVAAVDTSGNQSNQSAGLSVTTLASGGSGGGTTDTQAPTVPQNLKANSTTATQVNLTWSVSTDNIGVTGYRIYRNGTAAGTTSGNSYADSNLASSTQYSYSVTAYDNAGNQSNQSSSINASTLAGIIPTPTTGGPVPNSSTLHVYYVDQNHPGANDANVGTSESEPWKTPDKAFATVRPGDFVYIKGSTNPTSSAAIYDRTLKNGFNILTPGEAGKPIVFRSYPGHTVIMQANGSRIGILLDKASYHHFYGFIVRNFQKSAEGVGIKTDITIEKSEFTKTYEAGLRLRDVTNVVLRDVYIHHCFESGVSVRNGKNVLFERVESSYNNDFKGVDGDGDGFHTYGGDNIVFINSVARGNSEDGFDLNANATLINVLSENHPAANLKLWRRSVDNWAPKKMTVINSIFRNSGETGIKISEGAELHLYNSIVDNAGEDAIGFRTPSNTSQAVVTSEIINSIVSNSHEGVIVLPGNKLTANNNLYFQNDYRDVYGFLTTATSLIDVDPMFIGSGNYHLRDGSPAIDKGVILSNTNTQKDVDGQARPNGSTYDIGIDER